MDSIGQNIIKKDNQAKFYAPVKLKDEKKETKKEVKKSKDDSPKDSYNIGNLTDAEKKANFKPLLKSLPKPPTPEKELTVLFYMHGQYDDIGGSTAEALMNMERAGSNEKVNVAAQLGRNPYKPKEEGEFHIPLDGDWAGVRRYTVKHHDHSQEDISLAEWHKMEEKMPKNPILYFVLGNIYWGQKDKIKGMEYYDKSKEMGMLQYMDDYNSEESKAIREEFDAAMRPHEEAAAPYKNFASEVQEVLPEGTGMGEPATLQNFVEWGLKKYPAKHYMLVIMGHGGAWIGAAEQSPSAMGEAVTKGVEAANQETGRSDKFDVAMFNSCYMGNIESLYEMKDIADVTVASENYARSGIFNHWGMFLDAVSRDLDGGKPFDGKQFSKEIVEFYKEQGKEIKENFPEFSNWKESYLTLSAVDNSKLDPLAKSFRKFVSKVREYKVPDHILFKEVANAKNYDSSAHNPSQIFGFYDTIRDLGSFMDNVHRNPDVPIAVKVVAAQVKEELKAALINEQHEGQGMEGSQGMTFWGPSNAVDVAFMGQRYGSDVGKFAKGTGWGRHLVRAMKEVPQEVMTGFMSNIQTIREINAKLKDENITNEEKETLLAAKEAANKQALEFKKQMDLTIEREEEKSGLFKRTGSPRYALEEMGSIGDEMVDEIIMRKSMM